MKYGVQKIDYEITLMDGKEPEDGGLFFIVREGDAVLPSKTKKLPSPMSTFQYSTAGGINSGLAEITIWGINPRDLDYLTRYGIYNVGGKFNQIEVRVNKELCYTGSIVNARADFNQAPNVPLHLSCSPSPELNLTVDTPFSYDGDISLFDIVNGIASPKGYTVINWGEEKFIKSPYLKGSAYRQILEASKICQSFIEFSRDSITIMDQTPVNEGAGEIEISGETGLIGFPMYHKSGVLVKTYFNSAYKIGQKISLVTASQLMTGYYIIAKINHNLSCMLPNGQFYSELQLTRMLNGVNDGTEN